MIGVIRSDGWWRFACGDVCYTHTIKLALKLFCEWYSAFFVFYSGAEYKFPEIGNLLWTHPEEQRADFVHTRNMRREYQKQNFTKFGFQR